MQISSQIESTLPEDLMERNKRWREWSFDFKPISDLSMSDPEGAGPTLFRFSSRLTSVRIINIPYFDDKFIKEHLPNSIQDLYVFDLASTILSDHGISNLSNWINLEYLDLSTSPDITGNCFKFLPRHLRFLNAAAARWVWDDEIADLPPTLIEIILDRAKQLTHACLCLLPSMIQTLSLPQNELLTTKIALYPEHVYRTVRICTANFELEPPRFKIRRAVLNEGN